MNRMWLGIVVLACSTAVSAAAQAPAAATETGLAAVYTDALNGHLTASGQVFDQTKLTAAHKTLPFGTKIRVTNTKNHKTVELRVNDRGPRQANRVVDITSAAAAKLGFSPKVMREVTVEVMEMGSGKTTRQPAH